jgi:hypothetical protein
MPTTRLLLAGIARLWALPWTAVGVCAGTFALLSGGGARRRMGVIEFYGGVVAWLLARFPGAPVAMTLGHTILGRTPELLDMARPHELVHVHQYERWGPLFVPAYLLASLGMKLCGRDAYRDNPFEREAFDRCPEVRHD